MVYNHWEYLFSKQWLKKSWKSCKNWKALSGAKSLKKMKWKNLGTKKKLTFKFWEQIFCAQKNKSFRECVCSLKPEKKRGKKKRGLRKEKTQARQDGEEGAPPAHPSVLILQTKSLLTKASFTNNLSIQNSSIIINSTKFFNHILGKINFRNWVQQVSNQTTKRLEKNQKGKK